MELVHGARVGRRPGRRAEGARGELWGHGGLVRGVQGRGGQGHGAEGRDGEARGGRDVLPHLSQS